MHAQDGRLRARTRPWCSASLFVVATGAAMAACGLARQGLLDEANSGGGAQQGGTGPTTTLSTLGGQGGAGLSLGGLGGHGAVGGGGSAPAEEDCLDGVDNDGDSLVDCDDPECSDGGFQCVEVVPSGGSFVAIGGSCELPAELRTLSECDVTGCEHTADGGTCTPHVEVGAPDCSSVGQSSDEPDGCWDIYNGDHGFRGWTESNQDGTCASTTDGVNVSTSEGCVLAEVGRCSSVGQSCVPELLASAPQRCVLLAGVVDCPVEYPTRSVRYAAELTECACDVQPASWGCEAAQYTVWTGSSSCGGGHDDYAMDGACNRTDSHAVTVPSVAGTVDCVATIAPTPPTPPSTLCCQGG